MILSMAAQTGDDAVDQPTPPTDARSLAQMLEPALVEACSGRLNDIAWFRTDWQRGGAATGFAVYSDNQGRPRPAVIKLPVNARELRWTRRLQDQPCGDADGCGPIAPELFASEFDVGGYDFAWIVIERLSHGPLALHWTDDIIPRMARAAARFYRLGSEVAVDRPAKTEDWPSLLERSRENIRVNDLPDRKRWQELLRALEKKITTIAAEWDARAPLEWLHGDLHPANAMCRAEGDRADVVLIDFAEVHPGHWVEDAIYLERLLWSRPDRLKPAKPMKAITEARKAMGLPVDGEAPRLAAIRRTLLASTAPAFIKSEGNPHHLAACLARFDEGMKQL